ncbi:MAG: DNA-protecting protein DprA [Saprospiraceae bacterium]|nr:DNA-protecting protein DprA [Saprospiraceae bacterium]
MGTRSPSVQGKMITEKIVEDLSELGVVIISGLAYGIDGCAHKKSVEKEIPTIGVMGHGHDIIYPATHKELAKKMIKNGGLLTEFCSQTRPDKVNFPMRNRIIAALSDALIVVESKTSGGSIITAEFANEYNKDVFAIPGRPGDEWSGGCNALIKKHKAHLMEDVNDLLYIMRWDDIDRKNSTNLHVHRTRPRAGSHRRFHPHAQRNWDRRTDLWPQSTLFHPSLANSWPWNSKVWCAPCPARGIF